MCEEGGGGEQDPLLFTQLVVLKLVNGSDGQVPEASAL